MSQFGTDHFELYADIDDLGSSRRPSLLLLITNPGRRRHLQLHRRKCLGCESVLVRTAGMMRF